MWQKFSMESLDGSDQCLTAGFDCREYTVRMEKIILAILQQIGIHSTRIQTNKKVIIGQKLQKAAIDRRIFYY